MAHPRLSDPTSSDDDAPEVVSYILSKRNAKRTEKNLRDFEAEENARKKAQNRERDRKMKERAVVTRMGKLSDVLRKGKHEAQRESDEEIREDPLEARMRRAMQDAATEAGDGDDTSHNGDPEDPSDEKIDEGLGDSGIDEAMDEESNDSESDEEMAELDAGNSSEEGDDGVEDGSTNEDQEQLKSLPKLSTKGQYLQDELFVSAFTSQSVPAAETARKSSQRVQPSRKRHRRRLKHAKDLLVGTRTIRTLLNPLESNVRSTAHTIPPQKIRKFIDRSLAVKGKLAASKAKARGWERRPANIGVMKCIGAPSAFVRARQ